MSSHHIDEEKGEGGLKAFEARSGSSDAVPESPKSAVTLVNSSTTSSDDLKSSQGKEGLWTRRMSSVVASLGLKSKRPQAHESAGGESSNDDEDDEDEEAEETSIVRKIHDQPVGYPRLATFLDSDENFMIYRRFGYLQSRLLLERQDELRQLELDLDLMENKEKRSSPESLKTRRDMRGSKKELFEQIEEKWNGYCQLLSNAATMTGLNKPTSAEQNSVLNWLWNVKPLRAPEASFIHCTEDLVILRPGREHAWLDSSVEKMLKWVGWAPLRRAFQSKDTRAKSNGEDGTVLYTRSRIENVVVSFITLMILALLVVPIWVLYNLTNNDGVVQNESFKCIGVLLVSTLAFSACISLFTRAKRHEILGASAAYCAVLVVFVGNIGHR